VGIDTTTQTREDEGGGATDNRDGRAIGADGHCVARDTLREGQEGSDALVRVRETQSSRRALGGPDAEVRRWPRGSVCTRVDASGTACA
jgi:hypothetical protein